MQAQVLIVDDNAENVNLAASVLFSEDIDIAAALTGEEAIRFAKHNLPDLILLDIMMPGTDGFEVCRVLKADPKTKDIPIIFLTAKDDRESLVEGFKLGAVDYILKPFFEAELIARVKTHLMIQNQKKEILINQRKYKGLFHNTPIGLYQTDPEGNILMANQYLIEMLEFDSFEDLTKRNLEKETIEEREDFKIKIEEKGFIQNYEYSVYTKTGKELIILENAKLTTDPQTGKIVYEGSMQDITEKKQTEIALIRNEERYRTLVESTTDMIFSANEKGEIVFVNERSEHIFGLPKDEIVGRNLAEFIPPERKEILHARLKEIFASDNEFHIEFNAYKGNGELIPIEVTGKPIIRNGKRVILASARDISERKEAEEKIASLLESSLKTSNLLRQIVDSTQDLIFVKDTHDRYIMANSSYADILGVNPEDIVGKTDIIFTEEGNCENSNFINLFETNQLEDEDQRTLLNERITLPDGTKKIYNVQHIKLRNSRDEFFASMFFAHDITRRASAEESLIEINAALEQQVMKRTQDLQKSELNFRNLFEKSNDAIIINEIGGKIIDVNETAAKMLGYTKKELIGQNTASITNKNFRFNKEIFYTNLELGEKKTFETQNVTKDGKKIPVEINASLINYFGRTVIMSAGRDISERVLADKIKLKTIIKTEEKERNRFAKDLHDGLGATLSATKMYLNLYKRTAASKDSSTEILDEAIGLIEKAIMNAKEIAVNILPHDLSHFGLKASLEAFCDRINKIGSVNISFTADNYDDRLDEDREVQLFRAVNELINNTLKYANATHISISLDRKRNKVSLLYKDDGKGFDFDRIMASNKPGIGLNNIIHRAELARGTALIESKPGEGMTAKIYFMIED